MKHIGWCLDQIQIVSSKMPLRLNSSDDKANAQAIINEVEKYANTLAEIITSPEYKLNLPAFKEAGLKKLNMQAHEIEKFIQNIEHMLHLLDLYINELREIISQDPNRWNTKSQDLIHYIAKTFNDERYELNKEFKIALFTREEIEKMVTSEDHLAKLFS